MARIGAHFHVDNPLNEAVARGADAAQFFLGDPQGWKGPVIPGGDPAAIRDAFAAGDRLVQRVVNVEVGSDARHALEPSARRA